VGKDTKLKRIEELTQSLSAAAKAYYNEDSELMTNLRYDELYDELVSLEKETGIVLAGSPTHRVGYSVSSALAKEVHPEPMLSLDKTKEVSDLESFLAEKEGVLSWKLDGLTIALTYQRGSLVKAVTRGDGVTGEVVTENAKVFDNVPLRIPFEGELLIRGEAIIRYSDFERINDEIDDEGAKYKNPRNLCSGSVRQLNTKITADRHVRFYAFALVKATEENRSSRESQLEFLADQGFSVVEHRRVDRESVSSAVLDFEGRVGSTDLPSDGLVLIYDDIAYGQSLGRTAKFPRDAVAFKWEDELVTTALEKIEWFTSRTGLINPVAIFTPVEIEGTTVKRASLHNLSIIEELGLGIGDEIRVYKANMIIPQIAESLTKGGGIEPPDACPACGAATQIRENGDVKSLYCTNPNCIAKRIMSLSHFVSRVALDIEGLSEQTLEKLVGIGAIHEFADIFRLERAKEEIISLDGFGERSYENLVAAVNAARVVSMPRLLVSLGIPGIGGANAKQICRGYGFDWAKVSGADKESLLEINGIGEVLAESYTAWFADPENKALISEILKETTFDAEEGKGGTDKLAGLVFVITGSLEQYVNREELKAEIEANGGKVTGAVSEKTSYLINNDVTSGSSKNKKAKSLGVPIITEAEFAELL
jgi:DNA ligase (NAD+)